jgi:hypothetical protein
MTMTTMGKSGSLCLFRLLSFVRDGAGCYGCALLRLLAGQCQRRRRILNVASVKGFLEVPAEFPSNPPLFARLSLDPQLYNHL